MSGQEPDTSAEQSSKRFKQRAVIEFLTAEGISPSEIHRRLVQVYGPDCLDVSNVRRWVRRCQDEGVGSVDLNDKPRSGRPLTATDDWHKDKVDEMIQENRRITQREISEELHISQERVGSIITSLNYRKVCARWVPRMLTAEMKKSRQETCRQNLARFSAEGDEFLHNIVTADETWIHHYDPETKRQSMEYRHPGSPPRRKFKTQSSIGKVMATFFWDVSGIIHVDFLEPGTTINAERYISTLKSLKARLRRVRGNKKITLHHDNARPHTARATVQAIDDLGFCLLPHPPYSPDLAPCDFHLFPKLKEQLRGIRFDSNEEIVQAVRSWIRAQNDDFFLDGFRQLVHRWEKCVQTGGDYVEK